MASISRDEYTAEERKRCDEGYYKLLVIIKSAESAEPDAGEFRRALAVELAGGFPIDWADHAGWTLLHCAVNRCGAICTGLPQILIKAGADMDAQTNNGMTPLGSVCWDYIYNGAPEYSDLINILLEAGARPELDERWTSGCWVKPDQLARRGRLEAYIKTWVERRARDRAKDPVSVFDYSLYSPAQ